MSKVDQAKIAFVYSGVFAPGVLVGDPHPAIALACNKFPCEHSLSINFGVINFNGIDNYSLEIEIFFKGETVSLASDNKKVFKYHPQWGNKGEYVATMTTIQSFIAKGPGYYTVEATLLFKDTSPESVWETIDVMRSYFAIASEWRSSIDG
ncbi:hypothetical protein [Siccibacter colletis]|uniref:hypothetical protein n=1 Tax=Siccibacter colletis TaxID=1505757 RepID=UPI0004E24F6D|nr:hypothetical protein [Siccibacter colletis]